MEGVAIFNGIVRIGSRKVHGPLPCQVAHTLICSPVEFALDWLTLVVHKLESSCNPFHYMGLWQAQVQHMNFKLLPLPRKGEAGVRCPPTMENVL